MKKMKFKSNSMNTSSFSNVAITPGGGCCCTCCCCSTSCGCSSSSH